MALSDDVERLTRILVRMHQRSGEALRLRLASGREPSAVAKMCGASPEQLFAWERGTLIPSTGQGLTWLSVLHELRTPIEHAEAQKAAQANGR